MDNSHNKYNKNNNNSALKNDFTRPMPDILYRGKIVHSNETEILEAPDDNELLKDTGVIAETRYGKDFVRIMGQVKNFVGINPDSIKKIIRLVSEKDEIRLEENKEKEENAYKICREKIARHKLDMKLVSAHYLLEEPKVMFFFTADNRIDFRELVKDLVAVFKMRIELRQIGVRDESRVLGGIAVCGRDYCCHGVTDHLCPVSIKMAKEQNLSLNSLKISGPCGRLLCCLSYEFDYYCQQKKNLPSEGTRVFWKDIFFKVNEIDIFTKKLKMSGQDGRSINIPVDQVIKDSDTGKWKITSEELDLDS